MPTIKEQLEKFDEKFSNPNKLDSSNQFNPELSGKLYQEFKKFLEQALTEVRQKTIDECIEALPDEIIDLRYHYSEREDDNKKLDQLRNGHIIAIREVKHNLNNLKQ